MTLTTKLPDRVPTAQRWSPPSDRGSSAWVRFAAVGGLVFFGLFIAFATLANNTPAASDTRQEVFSYLTQHHDRLQAAAVVYALAMPAALLFWSALFSALRSAEGGRPRMAVAAVTGAVLSAAATVTGALVLGATGTRWLDLGPSGSRVFWTMFLLSVGATLVGQVLAIGATAAISWRTRLFARWFTIASVLLALVSSVGACTIGYTGVGIQAVAGIAAILDSVWILLAGLYLWRRPDLAAR